MTARRVALGVAVGVLTLAAAAASAAPRSGSGTVFRVRPDLRMCPSPICGGFWVSRVNRPTTTCVDGTTRAWCYVAQIDRDRVPSVGRTGSFLIRGRLAPGTGDSRPLGRLIATGEWVAATSAAWSGAIFLVTDTGVRCIRAPCFSLRAATVNTQRATTASSLDLSDVAALPALVRKAHAALAAESLLVAGTVRRDADGGRTVVAAQFFLAAA